MLAGDALLGDGFLQRGHGHRQDVGLAFDQRQRGCVERAPHRAVGLGFALVQFERGWGGRKMF